MTWVGWVIGLWFVGGYTFAMMTAIGFETSPLNISPRSGELRIVYWIRQWTVLLAWPLPLAYFIVANFPRFARWLVEPVDGNGGKHD